MTFGMIRRTFLLSHSTPFAPIVCMYAYVKRKKLCHCTQKIEYNEQAQTVG